MMRMMRALDRFAEFRTDLRAAVWCAACAAYMTTRGRTR